MEVDLLKKLDILREIKEDMQSNQTDDEGYKRFKELHDVIEQLDFSILGTHDCENASSPSTSKRRKTTRAGSESNDEQQKDLEEFEKQNKVTKKLETSDWENATSPQLLEKQQKDLEEMLKQIKHVKTALNIINDMENTSFRKFISKSGKKRRNIVSRVSFIKRINENGQAIPLWVGLENEKPPALCGAVEADDDYVAKVGDLVAALVTQSKKENWILAEVISYDPNRREYKVDDIYEEHKAEQILSSNKVIPLPKWRADPESNPEAIYPKDSLVLALYPGTTCFYRAIVGEPPSNHLDPYQLLFEDENYVSGYSSPISVHQRYVAYYGYSGNEELEESGK